METNTQAILLAKKAWKLALLLKKAISTTNLLFLLLLKRGNKAFHSFLLKHAFASQTDVVRSCPPFKEYEFSCSNSPAFQFFPGKLHRRRYRVDEAAVAAAVQRVFDILNTEGPGSAVATPMLLPGFGKSPAVPVRQLRVTDSPFPVKGNEEESKQVSKAAEEFITRFYRDLKREKSFESPYRHSHHY